VTDFDDRVRESANAAVDNERGLPRRGRDRRGSEGISYQTRQGRTGQRNAPANDHADALPNDAPKQGSRHSNGYSPSV